MEALVSIPREGIMAYEKPLTEKEASEIIGLSVHWLRRKRWEGDGPRFLKLGPGSKSAIRYMPADLQDFIIAHRSTSTSTY
jgi:hypothetical protein